MNSLKGYIKLLKRYKEEVGTFILHVEEFQGMQVLVSRLSASFIDSTASSGIDEQYAPLIEDSSNSSSSFSGPQVQETVSFCSSESPTRERRGSIYVVMRQRAPSYTPSFNNCVTITRINSF